jgi:energy-converting hydrogenase Eha subunit C
MSSYADREILVSGFTLGFIAMFIGGVVQFTHHGALNHVIGYALVASGVVLLFVCYLARASGGYAALIRTLLMAIAGVLLIGMLFKDVIAKLL